MFVSAGEARQRWFLSRCRASEDTPQERSLRSEDSASGVMSKLYDWLAVADTCQKSDVIFVLAGREQRKHFAFKLFREGWAPTLLISVGRFEIRRFGTLGLSSSLDLPAVAATTEPRLRHYFVTVRAGETEVQKIPFSHFGTLREIRAFSNWVREHPAVRSVMIVSSGFHLKRVRMCCRRLMPEGVKLCFVSAAEEGRFFFTHWWRHASARKLVLSEVVKLAAYKVLCRIRTTGHAFTEAGTPKIGA